MNIMLVCWRTPCSTYAHMLRCRLWAPLCLLALTHCGGAGAPTTSGSTPVPIEILSISELPSASQPVVVSASGNLATAKGVPVTKGASTGFALSDTTACTGANTASCKFSASSASNMCHSVNALSALMTGQIRADREFCIFKQLVDAIGTAVDVDDGIPHIVNISWQNDTGNKPTKVQFKKVVANNRIASLTLHHCRDSAQTFYTKYTLSDNDITIDTVEDEGNGATAFTITGTLQEAADGSIQFTDSKAMTQSHVEDAVGLQFSGTFTQTPSTFAVTDGAMLRSSVSGSLIVSAKAELLGSSAATSNPLAYAIGDGTGYTKSTFVGSLSEQTQNWIGDTTATTSTAFYTVGTPAAAPSSISVSFSGDAAWDCSGVAEAAVSLNATTVDHSCGTYDDEPAFMDCITLVGTSSGADITIASAKVFQTNDTANSGTLSEESGNPLVFSNSSGNVYFEVAFSEPIATNTLSANNLTLKTQSGTAVDVNFDIGSSDDILQVRVGANRDDNVTLSTGTTYVLKIVGDTDTDDPITGGVTSANTVDPTRTFYVTIQ